MLDWATVQRGIFGGESGGDYSALYNYQNRPGGLFQNTDVTKMTIDQLVDFTNPGGDYGRYVKKTNPEGKLSTPIGAYQVVGTTLKDAVKSLNISGDQIFDKATQDRIGRWIYETQGTGAWQGYQAQTSPLAAPSVRSALNMQPQQNTNGKVQPMQQRPQNQQNGLLGFFKNQNPSTGLTKAQQFAAALDPLIMPSMRAGEGIRAQGQQRVQENARSSSMEYLRKAASGGDKNAQLYLNAIESRSITPSEGGKGYVSSMATNAQNKVRANKIYSNGLVVQATDQGTIITAPNVQRLTGQAAQDALKAANNYEVELSRAEAGATAIGKISAEQSRDALQKIELTKKSITNIDMAIKAIDDGAKSGIIYNMLPNVTLASGQLETAMNNMGLDIISSVTFGALSEKEMRLAMETAVPRNLPPNELRQYLVNKKAAQQKAVDALYQAAMSLSDPNFDFNAHIKKKAAENTANIKVWNPNANNGAGGFE